MVIIRSVLLGILFMAVLFQVTAQGISADQWLEDIEVFENKHRKLHKNLFHTMTEAEFDNNLLDLRKAVPNLTAIQVAVGLARTIGGVGDGHTSIRLHSLLTNRAPFLSWWFEEGLFIIQTDESNQDLLGAEILEIGQDGIHDVADKVEEIIGHATGNISWTKMISVYRINMPEVLEALGVISTIDEILLKVKDRDGVVRDVLMKGIPIADYNSTIWRNLEGIVNQLYYPNQDLRNKSHWYKYLRESKSVYVQYNTCRNTPDLKIKKFVAELEDFIDENDVERLVVDLRHNTGGDNTTNKTLVNMIAKNALLNRRGHTFVLVGRSTFSAGMNMASDLEWKTQSILIGEMTGGKPNHYAETGQYVLPNSELAGTISILYRADGQPGDERVGVIPSIPAAPRFDDFVSLHDRALQIALSY